VPCCRLVAIATTLLKTQTPFFFCIAHLLFTFEIRSVFLDWPLDHTSMTSLLFIMNGIWSSQLNNLIMLTIIIY